MKKAFLLLLLFALLFAFCISCNPNTETPENESAPVTPTPEAEPEAPSYSIVGTWHYTKNGKDAYLQLDLNKTGWIHYYQYYGSGGGSLNTYIDQRIKEWGYSKEAGTLSITIAGNNIGGINTDRGPFRYVVSELTETTLYLTTNGAYDPVVPTKQTLTRGE